MAAMDASDSGPLSSSISIQEKASRNKRKFRADPPLADPNNPSPLDNIFPNYESFLLEKPLTNLNLEHHLGICDMCPTLNYGPLEELNLDEVHELHGADWSDITETQLEALVLSDLDMIYKIAIKRITSYGYTEELATNAVLRSGHCYGCKDTISNIVDNALLFLGSGHELDSCLRESSSEELRKLEKSVLEDMVGVLREVWPFFSKGDAMWRLLICDMNVSHACAMDGDPLNSLGNGEVLGGATVPQLKPELNSNGSTSPAVPELNIAGPDKLTPLPYSTSQTEMPYVAGIPNIYSGRFAASSSMNSQIPNLDPRKESPVSSDYVVVESCSQTIPQSSLLEEKPTDGRKGHAGGLKRENILRQKTIHLEKSHRGHGPKSILRANKTTSLCGLMLDKKCKSPPDSTSINLKSSSLKPSKTVGVDTTLADATCNISFNAGPSASSSSCMKTLGSTSTLPTANTEISLSLPSNVSNGAITKPNCSVEAPNCSGYAGIPSDKIWGQWVPEDKKDEMLLKLVPRVQELQIQLQEWNEWAQQKVMQAARRLSKDKAELQTLRQEKEEVARLHKEKQTLEENTMKKLTEMENALSKASDQIEKANADVRRLEIENSELRQEMEAAKLQAAESAASCQEFSQREMDTLKKFQSRERQKVLFHEELMTEKHKLSQLLQQLEKDKEYQDQLEARWRQEEKVKEEALAQAKSERKEREQIEVSAKLKEDAIRSKAESDLQRYKDDIRSLEHQIVKLRLMTDSSKIAALRWGLDSNAQLSSELMDSQESGNGDVQRDRECVMCLTEEMSVVFLPCAHQVVCTKCNEMHEKQGMKDCPSCRTPIQQRICVRSADS